MAANKISILQAELRDRLLMLKEDIDDIQSGDEYNPEIYKETVLEIKSIENTLKRVWD